jgi:3-deoxy-D-manno-octulosonic-acid transferase
LLVSGVFREDQPFFAWYGRIYRLILPFFNHFFVQSEASKKLLGTLGISTNVSIAGDTRFDRVIEIAGQFKPIDSIEEFCGKNIPVIVAGNTWEEDEEELDHYANAHPEIRFIIAPHSMDEEGLRDTKRLFRNSIYFSVLTEQKQASQGQKNIFPASKIQVAPTNVLIIDNIGMLAQLYRYATITYVGGGFVDDGVHNVLEAAVYGKPVLFGPVIEGSPEAMELVENGAGLVVDSALEVEEVFNRLLTHPEEYYACCRAAESYVYQKKGATEKIITYIQENLLLTN